MFADDAVRLVEYFLRNPVTAEFGPYEPIDGEDAPVSAEELITDRLYRLRMVDREERTVDVQVFLGIGDIGGFMWEQDVRALLRIAGQGHPALPEVLDGGYRSEAATARAGVDVRGMAFVATRGSRRCAGRPEIEHFATRPAEALRQFRSLADGLANLQHLGIAHRNVCPATIDVYPGSTLRLARFELSALVTDLFRVTLDSASGSDALRALLIQQSSHTLAYAPPERIAFVLADDASDLIENDRTDVYGLAAVVWEWFMGEFPAGQVPPAVSAVPDPAQAASLREAYIRFNRYLRNAIGEADHVPAELAQIIVRMLDPDPERRPSPDDVIGLLTSSYDRIMATWDTDVASRPHLVLFMPRQFAETALRWGWIDQHPQTEQGMRDLAEFLLTDLRGAYMTHSPHGADPFVRGGDRNAKRLATQVLRGVKGVWFCHYYRPEDEHGVMGPPTDRALVIKYVADNSQPWVDRRLRELDWRNARLVPEVELLSTTLDPDRLDRRLAHRPTWRDLVDSTTSPVEASPRELAYQQAIDWLIDYQDVELQARMYPFVKTEDGDGGEVLVRYDEERDQQRIHHSPLFVKFAASPSLRPEFGTFFGQLENQDGGADVDIVADRDGRPASRRATVEAEVSDRAELTGKTGRDRILLRRKPGSDPIPERGWIRAQDDRGSQTALDRQRDASYELYNARVLLAQIHGPSTIRTLEQHWAGAGRELKGDGPRAVQEMLVCEPFAAIQGPPGTGKTRVAASAVAAYLSKNPAARVLVSAQSNFALDNLAERLLTEIGAMDDKGRPVERDLDLLQPIALRVTSGALAAADRVKDNVQPWTRHALADRQSTWIRRHVDGLLGDPQTRLPAGLPDVLRDWGRILDPQGDSVVPELSDRLHRGANLVFATCSASTPELLSPSANAIFDWVVVEEAAKAWPTELAIPLVRGLRWTLIGDHYQLPAHRKNELRRFLDSCIADPHEGIAVVGANRDQYLDAFELFRHLFDEQKERPNRQPPPLLRMSVQFRMRKPIGELVSRVFYQARPQPPRPPADGLPAGGLETYEEPDPAKRIPPMTFNSPAELSGESLVWLDTSDLSACRDEPHWFNPGEAAVVMELLQRLRPFPGKNQGGYGETPLAVLTPYRAQNQLLGGLQLTRGLVSTIHAFQGREADMVIVSLVRDRDRASGTTTSRNQASLGHLSQPELVNVLFSRARRQLVIIGRFGFYAGIMGQDGFWTKVCRAVELNGTILSAREMFGDLRPLVTSREPAAQMDMARSGPPW